MKLQDTLNALKPYVIGVRYHENTLMVVDTVFKDNWVLPESATVRKMKGDDTLNYYMIYSELPDIGVDELLAYVDLVIKANVEREKKFDLLKDKIAELKEVFKKTPLSKLKSLKFSFNEETMEDDININELDDIDEPVQPELQPELQPEQSYVVDDITEETINETPPDVNLSEEDLEILEEERRAENFRQYQANQKLNGRVKEIATVELPPKKSIQSMISDSDCECGEYEACSKCMDKKDL